jgi:hypothetical protein
MSEGPLDQVLVRTPGDFTPAHPERAPWHQPTLDYTRLDFAVTDNRVAVPLGIADRVQLHGLERPTHERDWLEPFDWTPAGWGAGP